MLPGMTIRQCITMLMACEAQGATHVAVAVHGTMNLPEQTGIDWVSPHPVDGMAYISTMPERQVLSHEAAEQLDW
jgi:hypothetical protein